jgi:hypothetical protein
MAAVNCPSCGQEVDDGVEFCPHCDAIVDASAFEGGGAAEKAPPPPKQKAAAPGTRPADPRKAVAAAPAGGGAAGAPAGAPEPVAYGRGRRRRKRAETDYSPDRVLGDTLDSIRSMLPFDQMTFWGLFAMGGFLLFPWRFTQVDGTEIGAFGGGWPVVLLIALAGAALFLRTSDNLRGLPPQHLALGQIVAAALSVAYCAWYFFDSIDNHPYRTLLGTTDLKVSTWEPGVILCAFAAIAMGAGSVWAWMVENASI